MRGLAKRFDREPVDSKLLLRDSKPFVTKDKPGQRLRQVLAVRDLFRALKTHVRDPLVLRAEVVPPTATRKSIGDVIVIRRGQNRLFLYDGMKLRRTFGVATGQSRYPTPLGAFEIIVKWRNPWWYPPASDWAKDAEPIPPGPGNPLGTRWMGISAPAVGIHGTPDPASIGYSVSHGCIRMLIPEVEWLFNQVEVGTPGLHRSMIAKLRLGGQVAAVAVVAALLGLLIWKVLQDESAVTSELARGGTPTAPAFTLERLDGEGELALESLRGKTVVLNFWASWCGPCRDEMPLLQEGSERWRDQERRLRRHRREGLPRRRARVPRSLRRHVRERLRRQGLDRRPLRRDALSGDVLRRRQEAGSATASPVRSRRLRSSTTGSSGRSRRPDEARTAAGCCAGSSPPAAASE